MAGKNLVASGGGAVVPAYLKGHSSGMEEIGQDDVATPRLVLLQALSPELEEHDGAKAGEFWHSGVEQSMGASIKIVPLLVQRRYVLWRPRPEGGILTRSSDGVRWDNPNGEWQVKINKGSKTVTWRTRPTVAESGLADWGSSDPDNPDSQPAATLQYVIPCLVEGSFDLGPAVLTLQRSGVKVAKKLLGRLKIVRAPIYGLTIPMQSVKEQSADGPYYNVKFGSFGFVEESDFEVTSQLHEAFKKTGVVVKDEDKDSESAPDHAENADF
jgi:hypothetical protein